MTLTIPDAARFSVRAAFSDRLCRFWAIRNSDYRPTRIAARATIRHLIHLMRQLQP